MASQWYYSRTGQQEGPVSSKTLRHLAVIGELKPEHFVWKEGMAEWKQANKIKGLEFKTTPAPPPVSTPKPAPTPERVATPETNKPTPKILKIISGIGCLSVIGFVMFVYVAACITTSYSLSLLVGEWERVGHPEDTISITKNTFWITATGRGQPTEFKPIDLEFEAKGPNRTEGHFTLPNVEGVLARIHCEMNNIEPDINNPIFNPRSWGRWEIKDDKLYLTSSPDWYEESDIRDDGILHSVYVKKGQ